MLSFLPAPVLAVLNLLLISINTIVFSIPIFLLALLRPLLRFKAGQLFCENGNNLIYHIWMDINSLIMALTNRIKFRVSGLEQVKVKHSCFIVSNHLSWADIVILCHLFGHRIPITKFFLKHSLIYIPIIGLVCWGLGMPFLRRYSRQELLKNPKLKGKDIESTKKACRRLIYAPSALVNFAEGTRCTPEKRKAVNSPYRHLMPPKATSLAIALGQIGSKIDCMINLTLAYPQNPDKPFIALLQGRLKEVYAHVEIMPEQELKALCGDYLGDKQFKHDFTLRLRELWARKDALLSREVYHDAPQELPAADGEEQTAPQAEAVQQEAAADSPAAQTEKSGADAAEGTTEAEKQNK